MFKLCKVKLDVDKLPGAERINIKLRLCGMLIAGGVGEGEGGRGVGEKEGRCSHVN